MALVTKNFSDIITFTRASTGTFFNSAGVLTSASNNVARFDYNPVTLAARGLLIEEARTNSIRNNTMQGAVAGTPGTLPTNWLFGGSGPGTLTSTVVGIGASNGITYVDIRLSGTTSTTDVNVAFELGTQIAALTGQTWTESAWIAVVGGSSTNITNLRFQMTGRNSGGTTVETFLSSGLLGSLTGTLQRFTLTSTLANATTAFIQPNLRFDFSSGVAIDITLRIGLPQLEQGAFATSVIPTTTTALTRSADVASVNTLSPWFNSTTGTIYAEFLRNTTPAASTFPQFVNIDDGSVNNRLALFTNSSRSLSAQVAIGGVFTSLTTGQTWAEGTASKLALAYQALNHAASANGSSPVTNTAVNVPSGLTTMRLGDQFGGSGNVNGYLRRITYYPRRLGNIELQVLTAPIGSTTSIQPYSLDTDFIGNTVSIGA